MALAEPPAPAPATGALYVRAPAIEVRLEPRDDATVATSRIPLNTSVTAGPTNGDWVFLETGLNRGWSKRPELGAQVTAAEVARALAHAAGAARVRWLEVATELDPYRADSWSALRDAYAQAGAAAQADRIDALLAGTAPVIVGVCGQQGILSKQGAAAFVVKYTPGHVIEPLVDERAFDGEEVLRRELLAWIERISAGRPHVVGADGTSVATDVKASANVAMLEHQRPGERVRNLPRLVAEGCRDAPDRMASIPVVARDGWLEPLFHRGRPWRLRIQPRSASCVDVVAEDPAATRRISVALDFDGCAPSAHLEVAH